MEVTSSSNTFIYALLAGIFAWGMTLLGASTVFLVKEVNRKLLDTMLGFAAGIMLAAIYWSLLEPAIEIAKEGSLPKWLPVAIGFLLGGIFLRIIDSILPHLHLGLPIEKAEGISTTWKKSILLVLAMTLHNIPEGLAIGIAFGATATEATSSLSAAIALAIGIGMHNLPEGMAVSMPLRREGLTSFKSFWYGQLSGIVFPFSCIIGVLTVLIIRPILPYAMAFAAGAMIFVVVEELIPTSQQEGHTDLATMGVLIGFVSMMILDLALH